jgi:hypothetical protein
MADQLSLRGGTTAEHATFTGANKEVTVDTTKKTLVVNDGATVGGHPLMRENASNSALALGSAATPSLKFTGDTNTGIYSPGADQVAVATNGTGRLFINALGQVGVGTSSPSEPLDVVSASGTARAIRVRGRSADNIGLIDFYSSDNATRYATIGAGAANTFVVETANNERLRVDSSGRVGIGTSTPQRAVTAQTNSNGASLLLFRSSETNNDYGGVEFGNHPSDIASYRKGAIYYVSDGTGFGRGSIYICNDNAGDSNNVQPSDAKVVITTAGNVGIGTTSPSAPLHINGTANNTAITLSVAGTVTGYIGPAGFLGGSDSSLGYRAETGNNHAFFIGASEKARLDSSGRWLVGTSTAPTASVLNTSKLVVAGNAANTGAGTITLARGSAVTVADQFAGEIFFTDSAEKYFARIAAECDGTPGTNDYPGRLVFSVTRDGSASPTEAARINSNGYLKSTSNGTYNDSAGSYNEVYQASNNFATLLRAVGSSTYTSSVLAVACNRNTTDSTYNFILCGVTGIADRFFVRDSGNVVNTNNSYGAISDAKLKENIVDASSQWDDLKALQVRKYNFKEETGQPTHTQIGLVAQEVELVSPGLVTESPDRDEDGNDLGTVTKSVNYSVLYMKAVKALQEAMERIEQLEAAVTALQQS